MGFLTHKLPLSYEQVNRYLDAQMDKHNGRKEIDKIKQEVIMDSTYPPAGYGSWDERIIEEDGKYYVRWSSASSCD